MTRTHTMTTSGILTLVLLIGACGTSAGDIHSWGRSGDFERIRQELFANPPEEIRLAAAMQFGAANSGLVIPDLVTLSLDPSAQVRLAAVQSLGAYAGRQVYNAILQRISDDNRRVSEAAERILRTWGSESIEVMFEALEDRNFRVRVAAVQVLGRMKDHRVGNHLADRARLDDNSLVRREAVRGLGNLGFQPARKLLFKLKNTDQSKEVALEAERALAKIGGSVEQAKIAVAAFGQGRYGKLAAMVKTKLEKAMVGANLCAVVMPDGLPESREAKAALSWGAAGGAGQVVVITLKPEKTRVHVKAVRLEVGSNKLLQQEEATGYSGDMVDVVDELVKRFVERFM